MNQAEYSQAIAKALDEILNPNLKGDQRKIGFALLTYEFGTKPDAGRVNYIGNGNHDDVKAALKEVLARWDGRYVEPSTAQQ